MAPMKQRPLCPPHSHTAEARDFHAKGCAPRMEGWFEKGLQMQTQRFALLCLYGLLCAVQAGTQTVRQHPASAVPKRPQPRLVSQLGHFNVDAVAFSPDGRFVLTGSWDNTAC